MVVYREHVAWASFHASSGEPDNDSNVKRREAAPHRPWLPESSCCDIAPMMMTILESLMITSREQISMSEQCPQCYNNTMLKILGSDLGQNGVSGNIPIDLG